MLPDADGLDLCRRLRGSTDVPILMLTARGEPMDRVVGLEVGADDYLAKPFEPRELQARLRAILRRKGGAGEVRDAALRAARDRQGRARACGSTARSKTLTSYQFALLLTLAERAGRVLSRDALMDLMKGEKLEAFDRSVDVHISRIRAAIEDDPKKPRRILTVRGAGYVFARTGPMSIADAHCEAPLSAVSTLGAHPRAWSLMQRLYLQFYLTILLVLAVFVGAAALLWKLAEDADAAISRRRRRAHRRPAARCRCAGRRAAEGASRRCIASCASTSPSTGPTAP